MRYLLLILLLLTACNNVERVVNDKQAMTQEVNMSCVREKEFVVRGNSMIPLFKPGDEITALMNYSKCNALKKGNTVLFTYSGNEAPVIKTIKAVVGDSFKLKQNGSYWTIQVNNKTLTNSEGEKYRLTGKKQKMLSLYAKDYPIIPNDTLLLLGENPSGTKDSTAFGLVSEKNIIGKVLTK